MSYRIEFYELTAKQTATVPTAFHALTALAGSPVAPVQVGSYMRELWKLDAQQRWLRGQFRKFRMEDLPQVGKLGAEAEDIELAPGVGLIEKNFFTLYKKQSVLAWHANGHANTPMQFAKMLTEVLDTKVEVNPLIQSDAMKRLMKGDVIVRGLDISIPRPRDPQYYPEEEFSQRLFDAMAATDGDRIRVQITTDARINNKPQLATKVKRALKELVADDAVSTARVEAIEDGTAHPIDLIADRITSVQEIEHDGRHPPASAMYDAIDAAYRDEQAAIQAILGTGAHRID